MSLVEISFDIRRINEISNHPSVRPRLGGTPGAVDASPLLVVSMCLVGDHGYVVFSPIKDDPCSCEVHTACLPEGRGVWMRRAFAEAFDALFGHTLIETVVAYVPKGNVACRALVSRQGFSIIGPIEADWLPGGSATKWMLSKSNWLGRIECL